MPREYFPLPPGLNLCEFWKGYLRTNEINKFNRYYAKCPYCNLEGIEGPNDTMTKHKTDCPERSKWPENERMARKRPAIPANQPPITKFSLRCAPFDQITANEKLLKAVVTSIPFSFVNDVYVREFFDYVGVKIPDRSALRCKVMPTVLEEVRAKQKSTIASAKYVNIVIDGWTDSSHIYYVAVLLVFYSTCQYIGNLHIGNQRQKADVIPPS